MNTQSRRGICVFIQFLNDFQFLANPLEDIEGFGEFIAGVQRRDDGTNAAFIRGNGGKDDALREDAFLEEALTKLDSEGTFTNDNRCDGSLAVTRVEAKLLQAALEESRVLPQAFDQAVVFFKDIDGSDTGGYYRWWVRGAEEDGTRTLQEEVARILATGHISTERTDGLGEGTYLQGHSAVKPEMADAAAPILP